MPMLMHHQKAIHVPVPCDGLSLVHVLHVHAHDATAISTPSTYLVWVGLEGIKAGYGRGASVVRIQDQVGGGMVSSSLSSSCAKAYEAYEFV